MTHRRFFSAHPMTNRTIRISGDELFHLANVNRARVGDEIEVVDGRGSLFFGKIIKINGDEALLAVEKEKKVPRPQAQIVLGPSLVKKRPMNLMIEKLCEIGIDEIRPITYTRTDQRYSPAMLKKWQIIAIQALKVNKRLWLTDIYPPTSLETFSTDAQEFPGKIVLDIQADAAGIAAADFSFPAAVIVGPPGDFCAEERELLRERGFVARRINDCTLKTETAAISIAAVLKLGLMKT